MLVSRNVTLKAWLVSVAVAVGPLVALAGGPVEINNGRVKVRFTSQGGGIRQEYFARRGEEWVLAVESLRPPRPLPPGGNVLYDSARDGARRLIVAELLDTIGPARREDGRTTVELTGRSPHGLIRQRVTLSDGLDYVHVKVEADLAEPKLEYLLSTFTFRGEGKPDFIHTPKSKGPGWYTKWPSDVPTTPDSPEFVLGDRAFYAPAIIAQKGALLAAIVPDLDLINRLKVISPEARPRGGIAGGDPTPIDPANHSMPTALDYSLTSGLTDRPLLAYGLIDFVPVQHMRWRHPSDGSMVRTLSKSHVGYGFDLFVSADALPYRGFQRVARHQWQRYGAGLMAQPRPQAMPFEEYFKIIYPACLGWNNNQGFAEFEMSGQKVGGWRLAVHFWSHVLSNGPWWNNPRDAVGMYLWADRMKDEKLRERARRIVNLALLAPRTNGLFACEYHEDRKEWKPGIVWAGEGGQTHMGLDPTNVRPRSFHTAGCSVTALHLLRYHRLCEKDDRIAAFLRPYADCLLKHMDAQGRMPMFFNADGTPNGILPDHAEGGANLWFLCELYAVTKDRRYLDAAEKIAGYLTKEIIPRQRWRDFEGFFSCGIKPVNWQDPSQDQDTRGQMPMVWAAGGLGELFRLTGNRRYLEAGEQVIDYASLYQAVWDPHFVYTAYAYGGFDTDNGDAAWLNCHTPWTVGALALYGKELGRQDLLERAVAAARAGVTLINHPRHISNNIYRFPNYPLGLGPENINHEGSEQNCLRTSPGSGEGTGLFAGLSDALRELGGTYVDFARKTAVGVDGVYVRSFALEGKTVRLELVNQLAALPDPYKAAYEVELRVVGLPPGEYDLVINGSPARRVDAAKLEHYATKIEPAATRPGR